MACWVFSSFVPLKFAKCGVRLHTNDKCLPIYDMNVKEFGYQKRPSPHFVGSHLDPNCLQQSSKFTPSRQTVTYRTKLKEKHLWNIFLSSIKQTPAVPVKDHKFQDILTASDRSNCINLCCRVLEDISLQTLDTEPGFHPSFRLARV